MTEIHEAVRVQAVKVRRGLYELRGVTHTRPRPRYPGAPVCGGKIFAERFGLYRDDGEVISGSWECYCERCLDCDFNGWDTLRECIQEAPEFWMEEVIDG